MNKGLKLTDILVTIVIAIAFGIVYIVWGSLYYIVKPIGIHIDQFLYGMWFIAATVAYLVIRKPGVALLAEIAAASGEFMLGSPFGLTVLLYGVVQGLFAEFLFMTVRYKKYNMALVVLASIASCLGSIIMDFAYGEIGDLATWNLALFLVARFVGSVLFAGIFAYYLVKLLEMTGVTNLVRPLTKNDFDALDQK